MMTAPPPPALALALFRDALSRASHLMREAQTLADYEYRSPTPPRVARLILRVVTRCELELRQEWEAFQSSSDLQDRQLILNNVQTWDSLLRATGGQLRYVHGASASRVPSGLGRLLETIVQDFELGEGLLLREKWSYNYSVDFTPIEEDYRTRLAVLPPDHLAEIFAEDGQKHRTYAIGFPAIERQNTLLHCAIGHEIGHIPVARWLATEYDADSVAADESRSAARELLKDLIDTEGTQEDVTVYTEIVAATNRIQSARRRFVEEYASDIFAVELFGPAALLALTNIGMSLGLDSEPRVETKYYPSWRSRLRVALDWLRRSSPDPWLADHLLPSPWGEALLDHLDMLDEFLGQPRSPSNPEMEAADRLAKRTLEALGPALASQVHYPRAESMTQALVLADRIKAHTPPNDVGSDQRNPQPPHLAAILNAGWLYTIGNDSAPTLSREDEQDKVIVNRLMLKALSDVIIMRSYREFRGSRS